VNAEGIMSGKRGELSVKFIERAVKRPGRYYDGWGSGLMLEVGPNGRASWVLRYMRDSKERWHGLGSLTDVTLDEAREIAHVKRKALRQDDIDPIDAERAERAARAAERAKTRTFGECAEALLERKRPLWRHEKHASQWQSSLLGITKAGLPARDDYCRELRRIPVAAIDKAAVIRALEPIWVDRHESAQRLRNRIEAVLSYAVSRGYRDPGPNPASLEVIGDALPSRKELKNRVRKTHFAALDYHEIGTFMTELRALPGVIPRAVEFAILTAARTNETLGVRWSEVDLARGEWNIPDTRMKGGRDHRVMLSDAAIAILRALPRVSDLVFPSADLEKPLGEDALRRLVHRKMGRPTITIHGFRSTFSTWANEHTNFPHGAIEIALAHAVGTEVSRAYARGDMIAKRRELMAAWAGFCATPSLAMGGNVISIGRGRT
jgi:integrase